jgi:hypothetical protein
MLKVSKKELIAISKLHLEARYKYFIKKIADQQEVVIVANNEGGLYYGNYNDRLILHLWCATEFTEAFLNENKLQLSVREIDFDYLDEVIYPYIKENNVLLSIMPIYENYGHLLEAKVFSSDLKSYLDEFFPE